MKRDYSQEDVAKLRGTFPQETTVGKIMATKLRELLDTEHFISAFGAYNGQQAVQQVKAGIKAIYCSGWQVAASANTANEVYPDQSLYPVDSVPTVVRNINNAFRRQDQIQYAETGDGFDFAPIVADAEAGFGGVLNAYELARNLIYAGAAGVHFEDQLASEKKCGHLGGKVLLSTNHAVRNLNAARLAADVCGTDTLVIARTDAESARLMASDADARDGRFIKRTGASGSASVRNKTNDGFWQIEGGMEMACVRGEAYAQYADLVWCETSKPCLREAQRFADAVKGSNRNAMLAYNCSPSFNWWKHIPNEDELADYQKNLALMGYKFQFITLAGFHVTNHAIFEFARQYKKRGMLAYSRIQEDEIRSAANGYTGALHQREVGTGYFDIVSNALGTSTGAMKDSTETAQF